MATFFNLDPRVVLAIGAALVLLGLALAFWGRGIWRRIMALIGMVLGGIIGFIVVFALSYYFIEELLAILTAAIGGALLGFGVYILLWPGGIIAAAAAGIGVFALGMVYQTMKVRRQKRVAASMAAPPTAWANPPPPPQ